MERRRRAGAEGDGFDVTGRSDATESDEEVGRRKGRVGG